MEEGKRGKRESGKSGSIGEVKKGCPRRFYVYKYAAGRCRSARYCAFPDERVDERKRGSRGMMEPRNDGTVERGKEGKGGTVVPLDSSKKHAPVRLLCI